jgi:hypothetical protein
VSGKRPSWRNAQNTPVSPVTHSRRTVLEWLGKGATVAALPPALSACFPEKNNFACCSPGDSGPAVAIPGGDDTDSRPRDSDTQADGACTDGDFDFAPPSDEPPIYDRWNVRTVDPQDLDELLAGWVLTVDGMVDKPRSYTFAQLLALARQDQVMDFHCVEGWSVYDVPWNGLHIQTLLDAAGPQAGASHITFHTVEGIYNESLPMEVALEPHTMLAYGVCGLTLPLDHGFPLRLVVPRLLAYKNPKYVHRIEVTNRPIDGFWVQRGYSYEGEVPEDRLREGRY